MFDVIAEEDFDPSQPQPYQNLSLVSSHSVAIAELPFPSHGSLENHEISIPLDLVEGDVKIQINAKYARQVPLDIVNERLEHDRGYLLGLKVNLGPEVARTHPMHLDDTLVHCYGANLSLDASRIVFDQPLKFNMASQDF